LFHSVARQSFELWNELGSFGENFNEKVDKHGRLGCKTPTSNKSTCSAQNTAKIKGKRFRHGSKDQGRKFSGIGRLSLQKDGFFEQSDRTALQVRAS
jgi:hypothetical protein